MTTDQLLTILGSIVTVLLLPLLIDWVKRRWDYNASISRARFDLLSELNSLLWNYHGVAGRVQQLSALSDQSLPSKSEIDDLIVRFGKESDALYSGLYSCRSKILQYFDRHEDIDYLLDELRDWTFHGPGCADNRYLLLLHWLARRSEKQTSSTASGKPGIGDATSTFRTQADRILQLLADNLRDANSLWYPLRLLFRKKTATAKKQFEQIGEPPENYR